MSQTENKSSKIENVYTSASRYEPIFKKIKESNNTNTFGTRCKKKSVNEKSAEKNLPYEKERQVSRFYLKNTGADRQNGPY